MGDCQNYGPFLGPYHNTGPNTGPNLGDPKRDHDFDNPPSAQATEVLQAFSVFPSLGGLSLSSVSTNAAPMLGQIEFGPADRALASPRGTRIKKAFPFTAACCQQ